MIYDISLNIWKEHPETLNVIIRAVDKQEAAKIYSFVSRLYVLFNMQVY